LINFMGAAVRPNDSSKLGSRESTWRNQNEIAQESVEHFAKPIAVVLTMMGIACASVPGARADAVAHPSHALVVEFSETDRQAGRISTGRKRRNVNANTSCRPGYLYSGMVRQCAGQLSRPARLLS
jgi:hypothetical protein